jgi:acetoin utilization protein AcuB
MIVREMMSRSIVTVPRETLLPYAYQLMLRRGTRHLLVVGDRRELLGILTERDVRVRRPSGEAAGSRPEAPTRVEEVMTRSPVTVHPDQPATDAARLMLDHRVGALPVVQQGRPIGLVSETDVLQAFLRCAPEPGESA